MRNKLSSRNTRKIKQEWKPKINNGTADGSSSKRKYVSVFSPQISTNEHFISSGGETFTLRNSRNNHPSYSEKGTRKHETHILPLRSNAINRNDISKYQMSHLSEYVKRLSLLAKYICNALWKPQSRAYGEGECSYFS